MRKITKGTLLINLTLIPFLLQAQTPTLRNPLQSENLLEFLNNLLISATNILIPLLVLAIIFSGFKLVIAQGNKTNLEKAKKSLLYTLIGTGIVLGARVIMEIIKTTIESL